MRMQANAFFCESEDIGSQPSGLGPNRSRLDCYHGIYLDLNTVSFYEKQAVYCRQIQIERVFLSLDHSSSPHENSFNQSIDLTKNNYQQTMMRASMVLRRGGRLQIFSTKIRAFSSSEQQPVAVVQGASRGTKGAPYIHLWVNLLLPIKSFFSLTALGGLDTSTCPKAQLWWDLNASTVYSPVSECPMFPHNFQV